MEFVEKLKRMRGQVKVWVDGVLVADDHNMIVDDGLELIAQRIAGEEVELPTLLKFGTSSASTAHGMHALQGTVLFTKSMTMTRTDNKLKWLFDGTYTGEGIVKIGEMGIFNSSETMLCRFVPVPAFNVNTGSTLKVSWEIQMGV